MSQLVGINGFPPIALFGITIVSSALFHGALTSASNTGPYWTAYRSCPRTTVSPVYCVPCSCIERANESVSPSRHTRDGIERYVPRGTSHDAALVVALSLVCNVTFAVGVTSHDGMRTRMAKEPRAAAGEDPCRRS